VLQKKQKKKKTAAAFYCSSWNKTTRLCIHAML